MEFKLAWNYWIMLNYFGAMVWWACNKSVPDSLYWFFALGITCVVTFGYSR